MNKETAREESVLNSQFKPPAILDCNVPTQESTNNTIADANRDVSEKLTQNSNSNSSDINLAISLTSSTGSNELISCTSTDAVRKQSLPRDDNSNINSIKSRPSRIELEYREQEKRSGWSLLYARLNETSSKVLSSFSAAELPGNACLNRYTNILPTDSTRVRLAGLESTDYINANSVAVARAGTEYVMTQGPLPGTCEHFWHMVWQLECPGVVMLNRLVERGVEKCHPYFPTHPPNSMQFGAISVTCDNRVEKRNYFQTKLRLERVSDPNLRFLTHFQYTSWPDFGAPVSPHSFLRFLSAVRATGILHKPHKPAVVHCSAGVGRSGTFILIDSCLRIAERDGSRDDVSILDTVLEMRRQRFGCIQSKEQLRFSYACVIHGTRRDTKSMNGSNVATPVKSTKRSHVGSLGDNKEGNIKRKKC